MPTNKKLIAGGAAGGKEQGELAIKWGKLHWVRTAVSLASFTTMALALARLKHKA
jgi:hypothetical protein